jgi:phage baseplate assembly protein W
MVDRAQLFGNDLELADRANGFDLLGGARGDLEIAQGNDNIVQALKLRLLVHKGELAPLGLPDYGSRLYELIGEPNNTRTQVKLMAFARIAVEQDPRVLKVADVKAYAIPGERGVVRLDMDIQLIDQPNPLNLVVDISLEAQ